VDDADLRGRMIELEAELERYHERLEACLDHDRRFLLGATWGVVNGLLGLGAFLVIFPLAKTDWLGSWPGWVLGIVIYVVLALGGLALILSWTSKKQEDDARKLSDLPKWSRRRGHLEDRRMAR
jgi:hypothetical protein